jgi:periplasmic protein TonB
MNIDLSPVRHAHLARPQGGQGRHPVGLMVVIGLHVLVAGALLTARSVRTTTAEPPTATLLPQPYEEPKVVKTDEVLPPPPDKPRRIYTEPPKFEVDADPAQVATTHEKPVSPAATHGDKAEEKLALAEPVHFKPRAGFLDAGAAQCHAEYPGAAARAGATGVSRIRFPIDPPGKVTNAQILQSSGPTREHRLLDQAAAAALAQCPVTVGTDDAGHAMASTADVEYVWTLN